MSTTQRSRSARVGTDAVFGLVRDALATVLERDPATIARTTTLADLDADSLALVEVAEIVEERLAELTGRRLHIPDADLEAFATVGEAADYAAAWVG